MLTHNDDIDAKEHELAAQALRHALQAVLGSRVRANEGRSKLAGYRGDHDDPAGRSSQRPVSTQQRQERLRMRTLLA